MGEKIKTLMIYDKSEPSEELRKVLKRLGMEIRHVRNCGEASRLFKEANSAELVFTDTTLPDGTWEDVLRMAQQAGFFLPVIVVSRIADIDLYLKTLESGAFDFVIPPFLSIDMANVTGAAMYEKLATRDFRSARVA